MYIKSLFCLCAAVIALVASFPRVSAAESARSSDGPTVPCETSGDCTEHAECSAEKTCACSRGYVLDGSFTRCLREASSYGDECEESAQCSRFLSTGGVCESGECACIAGYHYLHGRCYLTRALKQACESDDDCYVGADHQAASCVRGVCSCSEGYYERERLTCRRLAQEIGDYCALDSDCQALKNGSATAACAGSGAQSKKCAYPNEANRARRRSSRLGVEALARAGGDSCSSHEDCRSVANSICGVHKRCVCERGSFVHAKFPSRCTPEIGERCQPAAELPAGFVCLNNVTSCESNRATAPSNRQCSKENELLAQSCYSSVQCRLFGPRASCSDGRCGCAEGSQYFEASRFCRRRKRLRERCYEDGDCAVPGQGPQSACADEVCGCPEGSHPNQGGSFCVSDEPPTLGNYCEQAEDCEMANVDCVESRCSCAENHFERDDACVAGLNAACSGKDDCAVGNSSCVERELVPGVSVSICQCSEGYVDAPDGECVAASKHGDSCEYDAQCVGDNLQCGSDKTCACQVGYRYKQFGCFLNKWIGEECSKSNECLASNQGAKTYCRNGVCSCEYGWKALGRYCVDENGASAVLQSRWLATILAVLLMLFKTL